jgi:hypothetical protein
MVARHHAIHHNYDTDSDHSTNHNYADDQAQYEGHASQEGDEGEEKDDDNHDSGPGAADSIHNHDHDYAAVIPADGKNETKLAVRQVANV